MNRLNPDRIPRAAGRRMRESGVALITAIVLVLVLSLLVAASLIYSQTHYALAWSQSRSESALLLADGGVNNEIQYISQHVDSPTVPGLSTQPVVAPGETTVYPGDTGPLKGRKGAIDGWPDQYFWVFTSQDRAGTTGWDGKSPTFWITSAANVNGHWRRVQVQAQSVSIFTLYAIFALAAYQNNAKAIQLSGATVTILGTAGTNGLVINNASTIQASDLINANTAVVGSGQFGSNNLLPGGHLYTEAPPVVYPTVTTVLKRMFGLTASSDAQAWTWLSTHNKNATGVYQYTSTAPNATIQPSNLMVYPFSGSSLDNGNSGNTTRLGSWDSANWKPGTGSTVKTIIFTPGDYYFTDMSLVYKTQTEIIIDAANKSTGGAPGQVRFWFAPGGNQNDFANIPFTFSQLPADPALFRFYYSKDGKSFQFGNTSTGPITTYGGVYAVTKLPGDTNSQLKGTNIDFSGGSSSAPMILQGSLLADQISFQGTCQIIYQYGQNPNDPEAGTGIVGGYTDGG